MHKKIFVWDWGKINAHQAQFFDAHIIVDAEYHTGAAAAHIGVIPSQIVVLKAHSEDATAHAHPFELAATAFEKRAKTFSQDLFLCSCLLFRHSFVLDAPVLRALAAFT